MELLKAQEPLGGAERGVTQQNKVQLHEIEREMPSGTLLEDERGEKKAKKKMLAKI